MWGFTTLFFAYQFIMRLAPGLVMPELMQKFQVDATDYGLFASMYYFAYSGMQIPVALLLDRFGPRLVIASCVFACSLGTLMLVYTPHWGLALLSRFLIGAGSAAGFLGTSKIISVWFPEKLYTKMVGITFTFGLLGAVYGGKPVGSLIAQFGWMDVLSWVGLVGLGLSVVIAMVVKNRPVFSGTSTELGASTENVEKSLTVFNNLKAIVLNKNILLIALANFLMVGALEGFADVWGVPYLMSTYGMLKENAAQVVSMVFVGMLFGGPILAYCAGLLRSNYWVTSAAGLFMGMIFATLLSFHTQLEVGFLYVLLFAAGIFCCYQVLIFSIGVNLVSKQSANLTVAFLNCVNMLGGSFFHSTIGHCMDFFWNGTMENGIRVYESSAYTYALSVIPITALLGSLLILKVGLKKNILTKEKPLSLQKVS
jgi:sugar phosphate permease